MTTALLVKFRCERIDVIWRARVLSHLSAGRSAEQPTLHDVSMIPHAEEGSTCTALQVLQVRLLSAILRFPNAFRSSFCLFL
jgi:hypothetical protein